MTEETKSGETKKCKACQSDISVKAKKCPNCSADQRSWFGRHPFLTGLILFIGLIIMLGSGDDKEAVSTSTNESVSHTAGVAAENVVVSEDVGPEYKWQYKTEVDEFTDVTESYALLASDNQLDFEFPYNGGSSFVLIIRDLNKGNGEEVIITVDKGQFMTYDEHIRVRFDDGEPVTYSIGSSNDGSADVIFIRNAANFIANLAASESIKVEAPFYQEGRQVVYFDTAGFAGLE